MHFVQAGLLAGLAALAIPILIHLLFRLRTRQVDLGTVRFLRAVMEESHQRRRVMKWLLLALRLACVGLLAVLFARPYLPVAGKSRVRGLAVLLIDRSATMDRRADGGRLIDKAVAEAKSVVANLPQGTRIEVAVFDSEVRPLGVDADGKSTAKSPEAALDAVRSDARSARGTDYAAAVAWARDVCNKTDAREKRVHFFTDMQRSAMRWSDGQVLPPGVAAHIHDFGTEAGENVAVTQVQTAKTWVRPGAEPKVSVAIVNAGSTLLESVPAVLSLESEGRKIQKRVKARLEPQATEQIQFDLPALEAGLWEGTVAIEWDDPLPFDNRRFVAFQASPAIPVLLVDGTSAKSKWNAATYFLEAALRLAPEGQDYAETPFAPESIAADDTTWHTRLDGYAAVVLANLPIVSPAVVAALEKHVERGGGLVIFGGDRTTEEGYAALAASKLGGGRYGEPEFATEFPWRIREIDSLHPLWAPLADPQYADVGRLAFGVRSSWSPGKGVVSLAKFRDESIALGEIPGSPGRVIWSAFPVDARGSHWPKGKLYVPMTHQIVGHAVRLTDGGPVRNRALDGAPALAADVAPGVLKRNGYVEVVNPSPWESELDRCQVQDLADRFGMSFATEAGDQPTETFAAAGPTIASSDIRESEFWHWILFALCGLFSLEFVIANRSVA